jgi:hypothetical protein
MKNTLIAAAVLTLLIAAARTGSAEDSLVTDAANAPPIQALLPRAESPAPKAAPEAKAEAPGKAEPAAEAPAAKPVVKAEPKPEAAKKPAEPVKALNAFAQTFVPLAEAYKRAHDEMQRWIVDIDAQTGGVATDISRIQEDIQKNEAAITKMKLAGGGERSEEGRALAKENKQLWADLSVARKERSALIKGFMREAVQRVKGSQSDILEKLEDVKSQAK